MGPRWLQQRPRQPKTASKMAQDSRRWFNIGSYLPPTGPKLVPRRFQEPTSFKHLENCLLYTSPSPRDRSLA
eukprot:6556939-Pyramimonas_sp.AAC.1